MKKFRVLASLFAVIVSVAIAPSPVRAAEESGWYGKAEVGVSLVNDVTARVDDIFGNQGTQDFSFDPGARIDLGIGYRFGKSWAVEFNPAFIYNNVKIDTRIQGGINSSSSDEFYQFPVMFNGIYTLPLESRFKPYAGLGIGLEASGVNGIGGDIVGAGQFIVGVNFQASDRIEVGLAYKALGTTEHDWDFFSLSAGESTWTHAIMATFIFRF